MRRPVEIKCRRKDKAGGDQVSLEGQSRRRSAFTKQQRLVRLPTAAIPPPTAGLGQIGLTLFFFLIFLFCFNFAVIIRNRFCFVFWLCGTFESMREKELFFFLLSYLIFLKEKNSFGVASVLSKSRELLSQLQKKFGKIFLF